MIDKIYFFSILLIPIHLSAGPLDTVSIKGTVLFDHKIPVLNGEFTYTIYNNSQTPQKKWAIVVHPEVHITSITQQNTEVSFTTKPGDKYNLLVIQLPYRLDPDKRTKITIKTSLLTQNSDPRFNINENFVFLDARKIWFPFPDDDLDVTLELGISTSSQFYVVMGSALVKENSNIQDMRISYWKNELSNLGLSTTLIITDKSRHKIDDIYVYTGNENLITFLNQEFLPLWNSIRQKQKGFPLSQLHILTTDLLIPGQQEEFSDGEFLGNLIFIDNRLSSLAVNDPKTHFYLSGPADRRLIETLIHEIYHSYFPGLVRHDSKESLFMESLVQYMTWSFIKDQNALWAKTIQERNRFLLQNIMIQNSPNYLWEFLFTSSALIASFEQSSFSSFELADTLVEKYRYITFNKQDFIETAGLYQPPPERGTLDNINLDLLKTSNQKTLFNSSLNAITTNFFITITNKKKKKILTVPVVTTVLEIEHNYPKEWQGNLTWIKDEKTNSIPLVIHHGQLWVTNLSGNISQAYIQSHLDYMESSLADNILDSSADQGYQLIKLLNKNKNLSKTEIAFTTNTLKRIQSLKEDHLSLLWDNTIDTEKLIVEAFLIDAQKNKKGFVQIIFNNENNNFKILEIIHPLDINRKY